MPHRNLFLLLLLTLGLPHSAAAASDPAEQADNAAIRQHRMGLIVVQTTPGARVKVEQTHHAFWFGAALANDAFNGRLPESDVARYKQLFLENFNAGVTENALKWPSMEPRRGEVNYAVVDAILAWTDQHQIPLRGHNLFWGIDQFVQPWVKELDNDALREVLRQRAHDIASRYKGRFAEYDLNNEMIHGNVYEERLGPTITRDMARWVKEKDPSAVLYLNDYDILTGVKLADYVAQIRTLLDMDVPVGGIGVQGHLHGESFDPAAVRKALDALAAFDLPIRVTEFNFPGQRSKFYEHPEMPITAEEEEIKARALRDYYRVCFAHPAVDGILMWGFWEGANWIPQSSLYKKDWSPTPAAAAYRDLVFKEWWTRWEGTADANGRCEVPAFYGRHIVTIEGRGEKVELTKRTGTATVKRL